MDHFPEHQRWQNLERVRVTENHNSSASNGLAHIEYQDQQQGDKNQSQTMLQRQSILPTSDPHNFYQGMRSTLATDIVNFQPEQKSNKESMDNNNRNKCKTSEFYNKREGVRDFGKEYEYLTCALYALKFGLNDDVVDFSMTTSKKECGDFDDIEIHSRFKNGSRRRFLFQLKHRSERKYIKEEMLINEQKSKQQRSRFYVPNFLESICKFKGNNSQTTFIFYTNSEVELKGGSELSFQNYPPLKVEKCDQLAHHDFLINTHEDQYDVFQFRPNDETEKLEECCKQFYFFTKQYGIDETKREIKSILDAVLQPECEVFGSFVHFMEHWWSENFILTKHTLLSKISEVALSPYVKTVSGINNKRENIKKMMMDFEMIIVDSDQEDVVRNMWPEVQQAHKYKTPLLEIPESGPTDLQRSKIMWLLDEIPLIVKVDDSNKHVVENVTKLLHKSVRNKKIILLGDVDRNIFEEWKIFETMYDANGKYLDILEGLNISLQGRQEISLKQLVDIDREIAKMIRVKDLLQMSENVLVIGEKSETLPELHIPRIVSITCVKTEDVINLYKYAKNEAVVIINCQETFKKKFPDINVVEISEFLNDDNDELNKKLLLISVKSKCTNEQFDQVCEKFQNVFLLQVFNEEDLILLQRKGNIPQLNLIEKCIQEEEILNCIDTPMNVFCAPPGMGKSRLMQVLNANCPATYWSVHINLINSNSFLAQKPNNDQILTNLLDDPDPSVKQMKQILLRNQKLHIFLDGLDEVDSKYVTRITDFVKYASTTGVKIWVSSRENLRDQISRSLNVVPIEIKQLDEEQQKEYIWEKLKVHYQNEEIERIISLVLNSVDLNNSRELLGIPLQLHIITEMFLQTEEAYKNLERQNIFVLTQMYKLFFKGKIESTVAKVVDKNRRQLGFLRAILTQYEILALKACLDSSHFQVLEVDLDEVEDFVAEIKEDGDKHGIIRKINDDNEATFHHQTYAEYFACVWFKKNKQKLSVLREVIFSERYENLRLMLDVMMGENSMVHLAIIYKNIDQFKNNVQDLEKKDAGGRTALQLACCYGYKYPSAFNRFYHILLPRESAWYIEIIDILLTKGFSIKDLDRLFDFSCIDYAFKQGCLYPLEAILSKNLISSDDINETVWQPYKKNLLAYYAAMLGYPHLLNVVIQKHPELVDEKIENKYLLETAVKGLPTDVCTTPRPGNIAAVKVLTEHGAKATQQLSYRETLLDVACVEKRFDMIKILVDLGAECAQGNTIWHRLAESSTTTSDEIDALETLEVEMDVNAKNKDGNTPLHVACEKGNFELTKLLIRKMADPRIVDRKNRNALHYASQSEKDNQDVIYFLTDEGMDVNNRDRDGRTAIHLASEKRNFINCQALVTRGADPNIMDKDGHNALHHASQSWKDNEDVINLIIDFIADINAQDNNGSTSIHLACDRGRIKNVLPILQKEVNPNIVDHNKKNALHYALLSKYENSEITASVIEKVSDVNAVDADGRTALLLACQRGKVNIIEQLLERGAHAYVVDNDGNTALHYASRSRFQNCEIIRLLVSLGVSVSSRNKSGQTALNLAKQNYNHKIAEELEKLCSRQQ